MGPRLFQVDAFADRLFRGNPAAVCLLETDLAGSTLQAIAAENNLSETAFFRADDDRPELRWFTPTQEVPLCGHATLAAGYVALEHLPGERSSVTFDSASGPLTVSRAGGEFRIDLPRVPTVEASDAPEELMEGLGLRPIRILRADGDPNYLAILESEAEVLGVEPDVRILEALHPFGVAVSAPGREADFVSRYFAPSYGIPEDPVTGSIHCALGPYWARKLGTRRMRARQLSKRGGSLGVEVDGDRVGLTGGARLYLEGTLRLEGEGESGR